jgi:hypothetical protein
MRTEISQAKRENSHYLASVEKGKEIEAIVERKRKRGATEDEVRTCSYSFLGKLQSKDSASTVVSWASAHALNFMGLM